MLLDDELPSLTYLKMLCEQIPGVEIIRAYNSPERFLAESSTVEFDLCILDVDMPGINGIQVANLLKGKAVVFATAYKEFAAEAFDLDAIDYIRKPIQKDRLEKAIQKVRKRMDAPPNSKSFMLVNTEKGKTLIHFSQLGYVTTAETDSRDKTVYLKDGNSLTLKNISFEKLLEMLPRDAFCRVNKREIMALDIVTVFTFDEITTNLVVGGKPLVFTLSETFRNGFLQQVKS